MKLLLILFVCLVACNRNDLAIIADGNSYPQGNGRNPFPAIMSEELGFTVKNFGVGGQTTRQMISDEASQVLSEYQQGETNILLVVEGGNDIYYFGDVDRAVSNMKTYCLAAKHKGFRVIVSTVIHRDQTTKFGDNPTVYNSKLDAFNEGILSDSSYYDAIIRPDLEPLFKSGKGYDKDGVHPNDEGQKKLSQLFMIATDAVIKKDT